jgi:hypothetical protein
MTPRIRTAALALLVVAATVWWTGCTSSDGGTVTTYVGVSHGWGYGPGWGGGWRGGYYPGGGGVVVVGPPVAVPY